MTGVNFLHEDYLYSTCTIKDLEKGKELMTIIEMDVPEDTHGYISIT